MKNLPSKADMEEVVITLRERASIEGREGYPTYAVRLRGTADFLESLAAEKEEQSVTKTIVIDPGRKHSQQCPFWTGAGAERHCGICPPDIELGHCFGEIPVWCPLPVLVRLKTPEKPDEPKVESLRDAAQRLHDRVGSKYCDDRADLCAIVLRRVEELARIVKHHLHNDTNSENWKAVEESLDTHCAEIEQMREGCE